MSEYGILTDCATGQQIRPASKDEWLLSLAESDAGRGGQIDVAGRAAYVTGGPESTNPVIVFGIPEQATFIAEMPQLAGNGYRVAVIGTTAVLTAAALDVLADLPDDNDGHYDGSHVWIGGSKYPVVR